jgi:hypothetical protein
MTLQSKARFWKVAIENSQRNEVPISERSSNDSLYISYFHGINIVAALLDCRLILVVQDRLS